MKIFHCFYALCFLISLSSTVLGSFPFVGKLSKDGINFHGNARFDFQIVDGQDRVHWTHDDTNSTLGIQVVNGRYSVNIGGQGMNPLPTELFLDKKKLFLRISVDLKDGQGLRMLSPDHRISSVAHSLTSDLAEFARQAAVAEKVKAGAVTKQMLGQDVLSDLNRTVTANQIAQNTITTAQLNEQILKYLKPEITHTPQAPGLIFGGQTVTLLSQAEGKYLSYQWYKNGQPIAGATGDRYVIEDIDKTQHDGNYSLVVSNDFGTVTTQPTQLVVDGTPTSHTVPSISMDMIFCPPGTFTMGSPSSETGRGSDETQHQVTLTNGFYLGKYEVTQAQYETVMTGNSEGLNAKPGSWQNNPNHPVNSVSWNDLQVFLSRLNDMEETAGRLPAGWKYVLPTEAQWEYACRAGTNTAYSWGDSISPENANYVDSGYSQTRDVGQYSANSWGFFDMHGNVWEWVSDWKANYFTGAQTDPEGPASGSNRARRGGSWYDDVPALRSANRSQNFPGYHNIRIGFRVGFQKSQ